MYHPDPGPHQSPAQSAHPPRAGPRDEDALPTTSRLRPAARRSLFQSGIGLRLALAALFSALVWLTIAWALAT